MRNHARHDLPAEANLRKIKRFLARGGKQDWWHYEVGCATDAWHRA
jgi:myo-inositol catabolism protein IolC